MKKEYIHFRIEPEVKEKAVAKAESKGKTLSSIICDFLTSFISKS